MALNNGEVNGQANVNGGDENRRVPSWAGAVAYEPSLKEETSAFGKVVAYDLERIGEVDKTLYKSLKLQIQKLLGDSKAGLLLPNEETFTDDSTIVLE
ncbi:unnamed protein product [Bursaphelenchus okinawaensis]|uniref:Uncharacterized protein n=1 Tax=Bursaphelenchus okinawaensis TaxID=465554 RepID=A0A811JUR4_9BILA|nr:unnamed protein product [Bursaphelenchus okinawaensis]CAG9084871.1 unnamed protein product [Bursaphelenchus okinawaensis]